ncbi:hypothetical protein K0M31_014785 [Melipona bicolor]|uniref:Uncharacterized protein n=1 Tax=Melipona bicolor TaxID=60889 RepID=A0AA40FGU7_9HYME|nr:hypothetical protein K0M31_014785 [Melipona bicolor]
MTDRHRYSAENAHTRGDNDDENDDDDDDDDDGEDTLTPGINLSKNERRGGQRGARIAWTHACTSRWVSALGSDNESMAREESERRTHRRSELVRRPTRFTRVSRGAVPFLFFLFRARAREWTSPGCPSPATSLRQQPSSPVHSPFSPSDATLMTVSTIENPPSRCYLPMRVIRRRSAPYDSPPKCDGL